MDFHVVRDHLEREGPTMGYLTAGSLTFRTLERPWLDNERATSCIPPGTYQCKLLWSNHFGRNMPHLLDVPDRAEIMIHNGNTVKDTTGCIIVGTFETIPGRLAGSTSALIRFESWLNYELVDGDVYCDVSYLSPGQEPAMAVAMPRNFEVT